MKKYLFFFVTLYFTTFLFSSNDSTNICLDGCIVLASAKILHLFGYHAHQKCTRDFNNESTFDKTCAHSTGIVWTTYGCNVLTGGTPCPIIVLCAPVVMHNAIKRLQLPQMR